MCYQLERLVALVVAEDRFDHLGPAFEPLLPLLTALVKTGVLDRHPRGRGECHDHLFVLVGEFRSTSLLGEVEVAEDLVPDAERNAQEGMHRRVVLGESVGPGIGGDVAQPHRAWIPDQQAEDAVTVRDRPDGGALFFGNPMGDELGEPGSVAA